MKDDLARSRGSAERERLLGELKRAGDRWAAAVFTITILVCAGIVAAYHDHFWWPPDEGNYAHVADRLLAGETLHKDMQDVHAGYVDFANAAAFELFGIRLVSLRYPVAFLTVVQAGVVFLLLRPKGLFPAAVGALGITSLGFVQFLQPSANWYALFLVVVTIAWLDWIPAGRRHRDLGTGFLVGLTFLFRQLSGVLLGMGVLAYLLLESREGEASAVPQGRSRGFAGFVLLVLGAGLAAYLAKASEPFGWLLIGIWPFLLLADVWRRTTVSDRSLVVTSLHLVAGAAIAALPLVAYHVAHNSLGWWMKDSFGAAIALSRLDFVHQFQGYLVTAILGLRGLASGDLSARVNGAFWLVLLLLPAMLALVLHRSLTRGAGGPSPHPLPVIAVFYAIGALHYQIPMYLFAALALCVTALIWERGGKGARAPAAWLVAAIAGVALYYHAGMPLSRGLRGTVAGERRATETLLGLERGGLYVESEDASRYRAVVALIERETDPGDTILAVPGNAELYFLAERTNPFRFYNSAVGIRSPEELDSALYVIACHPPALVFHDPGDKYNTAVSARLMSLVRAAYHPLGNLPPWLVFRRRDRRTVPGGSHPSCRPGTPAGPP